MRNEWTEDPERLPTADAELAARLKAGERQAYAELLERHEKTVFRFAYGFFRDREEAMEIVQETFLRVFRKIDRYHPSHALGAWIMRIAHNLCVDQYRRRRRQERWSEPLDEARHHPATGEPPPEERLAGAAVQAEIGRALEALSARQRAVFELRHGQGLKLEQIAATLGVSPGTVKTLHHRALKVIRRQVAVERGGNA